MSKDIRPYQKECIEAIDKGLSKGITKQLAVMATGCHAKGTPILMFDGSIKKVEDVVVGDQLMGDDSTERNVLALARGREKMYKIVPTKGEPFVVNENHILSLKRTGVPKRRVNTYPEILNITVAEYIHLPKSWKHLYKLYRVPVVFSGERKNVFTHPYLAGLWVADGTLDRPEISKPDNEVFDEIKSIISDKYPGMACKRHEPEGKCPFITMNYGQRGGENNVLLDALRYFVKDKSKRIHQNVLTSSRNCRLLFLAGLLDGDGYCSSSGFEISTKYDGLKDDILYLARSLGFAAYSAYKKSEIKSIGFTGYYHRISISGDCSIIPTKIKRKQAAKRQQVKNVLMSGFQLFEQPEDDYYGFALDGNHLYCMGDFTVTHNTGKTFTAVKAIQGKGRVLWGTHTEELISQSAIALLAELDLMPFGELCLAVDSHGDIVELVRNYQRGGFFADPKTTLIGDNIGVIKADVFVIDKPFVMASMQTLHRRLERLSPDHFGVIVVDEAHYAGANTWVKALDYFRPQLRLGLTATPHRTDNMLLGDLFDEIVFEYNIDRGIADGYLCELDAIRVKTNIDLDKVKTTAGELNQGDLEEVINTPERNALVVEKYLQYASGRQFIAFCVDVQHAQDLCEMFNSKGVKTNFVVGDKDITTDRKGVISDFKKGLYVGLVNVSVLVAGFDHSNVGCVIQACPTKSLTKYLQQVGRGTRLKDQLFVDRFGQKCIILDFIDNTSKHRLINTWTLDRQKDPNDRTFTTKEKKALLNAEREAKRFKFTSHDKDTKVDLLKLPTVKISDSIRMQEPATEKQLQWIASLGYDIVNTNYTKKMCSDIISAQPASEKQIWLLAKKGYDVSQGVTIAEAKLAFEEIEKKEAKANSEMLKKANKFPFNDIR